MFCLYVLQKLSEGVMFNVDVGCESEKNYDLMNSGVSFEVLFDEDLLGRNLDSQLLFW